MKQLQSLRDEECSAAVVTGEEPPDLIRGTDLEEARRRDRRWRIRQLRKLRSTLQMMERLPEWLAWFVFVSVGVVSVYLRLRAIEIDAAPLPLTRDDWLGALLSAPVSAFIPALLTRSFAHWVGALVRVKLLRRARMDGLINQDEDPSWHLTQPLQAPARQSAGASRETKPLP